MALGNFSNLADGTLASAINAGATSATLTTGQGAYFPSSNFWAVLWSKAYPDPAEAYRAGKAEVVLVSSRSTDVLTITRAQQGTSAVDFTGLNVGVVHSPTQADYDYIRDTISALVSDVAYDASSWNGVTGIAPSKNAVRDKFESLTDPSTLISDTAYNASSWDGVTTIAPSKNAVRDEVETLVTSIVLKSPLASPTFTGTVTTPDINVSGATVSTLAMFDGSKNLESVTLGTALSFSGGSTLNAQGIVFQIQSGVVGPADATIYYFANDTSGTIGQYVAYASNAFTVPKAMTIKRVTLKIRCTVGTNETVAMSFRLNDTTDTAIGNFDLSNAFQEITITPSIAVVVGDTFSIKMAATTWATNPTNVRIIGIIYGE